MPCDFLDSDTPRLIRLVSLERDEGKEGGLQLAGRLRRFVESYPPQEKLLPLVHTTSSYRFRNMLEDQSLAPQRCKRFKERLLYLFYGRPAYKVDGGGSSRSDYVLCPVCFVLSPTCISSAKRIYPFDSGAFLDGLYLRHVHLEMTLAQFQLGRSVEIPARVVTAFFGTNRDYYLGRVRRGFAPNFGDMEVCSYVNLISEPGKETHDDRRYTIEIQTDQGVPIQGNVEAVVLPMAALDDPEIREVVVGKWRAAPVTYDTFACVNPEHYHAVIRQELLKFLTSRGYL